MLFIMTAIRGVCGKFLSRKLGKATLILPQSSLSDVVPSTPQWSEINENDLPTPRLLTAEEVEYLESISLVQYKNTEVEKARLEYIIRFSDSLDLVNTDNVEPMVHVFENKCLHLRADTVEHEINAKEVLKNAKIVEEDYFVAPPGNVPFLDSDKYKSNKYNST